jgi:hypothetical protein
MLDIEQTTVLHSLKLTQGDNIMNVKKIAAAAILLFPVIEPGGFGNPLKTPLLQLRGCREGFPRGC